MSCTAQAEQWQNSSSRRTAWIFSQALKSAQAEGGKVVTIHSRRAARDVIGLIEKLTTPERVLSCTGFQDPGQI